MKSISDIFELLGGTTKVAQIIGAKPSSANEMKRRKVIPVKFWPRLINGCKERNVRGVNPTLLMYLHSEPGPPPAPEN